MGVKNRRESVSDDVGPYGEPTERLGRHGVE